MPSTQEPQISQKTLLIVANWNQKTYCLNQPLPCNSNAQNNQDVNNANFQDSVCGLKRAVSELLKLPLSAFNLSANGKSLSDKDLLQAKDLVIRAHLRNSGLQGGKGGFGSLLRSMKPRSKGDQNYDSCRDLSGRRLRHQNNQQRLREWTTRQQEQESFINDEVRLYEEERRQMRDAQRQQQQHKLDDEYVDRVERTNRAVQESVAVGLKTKQEKQQLAEEVKLEQPQKLATTSDGPQSVKPQGSKKRQDKLASKQSKQNKQQPLKDQKEEPKTLIKETSKIEQKNDISQQNNQTQNLNIGLASLAGLRRPLNTNIGAGQTTANGQTSSDKSVQFNDFFAQLKRPKLS